MPTYVYRCNHCDHTFEIRQSIHDEPLYKCPECKCPKTLGKVIQPIKVLFKGEGWTDMMAKGKFHEL